LRNVFDAIFYVWRSGCSWRPSPGGFPPPSTVYYHSTTSENKRKMQIRETLIKVARAA
jgi:transposase